MPEGILVAVISALVALLTSVVTGYLAWLQLQREKDKWVTDLKAAYHSELYKARIANYPKIIEVLGELSHRSPEPLTPAKTKAVADKINGWLYSTGGLVATEETRGALLGLRETCLLWEDGSITEGLYQQLYGFRDHAILFLRRDLDLKGLESYNFKDPKSVLDKLRDEV